MKDFAYFDNAATSFPKSAAAVLAADRAMRTLCVNAGRGQYGIAAMAAGAIEETRGKMLRILGGGQSDVCVFCDSATAALNRIVFGLEISADANVFASPFEHNAALRPLFEVRRRTGCNFFTLPFDEPACEFQFEKIKAMFAKNPPDFVFACSASNAFGLVLPIEKIAEIAKNANKNAKIVVDCSQTAGLLPFDFDGTDIDFAVFSGHKTLCASFGAAGFVCKKNCDLQPTFFGGTGVDSASEKMPDEIPQRFEAGSPNIVAISALGAAADEIEKIGIANLQKCDEKKRQTLLQILHDFGKARIFAENVPQSVGIVSAAFDGFSCDEAARLLDERKVCVRAGLHCVPLAHKAFGTFPAGTVRFSTGRFTDDEDFEILARALQEIKEAAE